MKIKTKVVREMLEGNKLRRYWYWCLMGKALAPHYGHAKKWQAVKALQELGIKRSTAYNIVNTLIRERVLIPVHNKGKTTYSLVSRHRHFSRKTHGVQKIRIKESETTNYKRFREAIAAAILGKTFRRLDTKVNEKAFIRLRTLSRWFGRTKSWWSRNTREVPKAEVWSWKVVCGKRKAVFMVRQALREGHYLKIVKRERDYLVGEIHGFRPDLSHIPYTI